MGAFFFIKIKNPSNCHLKLGTLPTDYKDTNLIGGKWIWYQRLIAYQKKSQLF